MTEPTVIVHADADLLAASVAARLALRLADAQATGGSASVVLTGGTIAGRTYATLRESPLLATVDWSRVDVWWGDERFLPSGDPDRNETQAREALLDALPLTPSRVHAMPASDGPNGDDPDAAAARYTAELAQAAPHFDLVLLGVGPDGHVASLFPGHPNLFDERPASGVRDSPKPPPTRITLSFDTINTADEVWIIASGAEKADAVGKALSGADRVQIPAAGVHGTDAVGKALSGADRVQIPAAGVHGTQRTLWLIDRAAAG